MKEIILEPLINIFLNKLNVLIWNLVGHNLVYKLSITIFDPLKFKKKKKKFRISSKLTNIFFFSFFGQMYLLWFDTIAI